MLRKYPVSKSTPTGCIFITITIRTVKLVDFYIAAIIQAMCFGPLVVGLFLSMKIFNIPDITTDGSYTLGAVISAVGLSNGYPPLVTLLFAMGGGALAGCCTALVHTWLR